MCPAMAELESLATPISSVRAGDHEMVDFHPETGQEESGRHEVRQLLHDVAQRVSFSRPIVRAGAPGLAYQARRTST